MAADEFPGGINPNTAPQPSRFDVLGNQGWAVDLPHGGEILSPRSAGGLAEPTCAIPVGAVLIIMVGQEAKQLRAMMQAALAKQAAAGKNGPLKFPGG